jgi:putative transposase
MWKPDGTVRKALQHFNDSAHAHELTFSCRNHWPLLNKDRSRQWVVEALDFARSRYDMELWAYVIMPEHVHALLYPRHDAYDMAKVLQSIKQSVARKATNYLRGKDPAWLERLRVSRANGRVEYRFWEQGGGYDRNIFTAKAACASIRYLHDNPVRRGLVDVATDWRWSSARSYAGLDGVVLQMDHAPSV